MAQAPGTRPAGPQPLEGSARVFASLAVALATFMNVLDTSIANVSIPAIAGDLGVSPNQGTWTITSFAVANAISVPLTGWLTQRYGQVRMFLATTALFVVASLLCGLAVSMPMLVAFRVVQGAECNQHSDRGCKTAEEGSEHEEQRRGGEQPHLPDPARQPARQRHGNRIGDGEGRNHPRPLIG